MLHTQKLGVNYNLPKKRWAVEIYHRALKNNTSVRASPTKTIKTQCNHIYASVMAFVKLEVISIKKAVSQYTLKSQLYLRASLKTLNFALLQF